MMHILLFVLALLAAMLLDRRRALACTGFAAGKRATKDGTFIIGRTEDISAFHPKHFTVNPACPSEGSYTLTDPINGFSIELPAKQCRQTMVRDVPEQGDGLYPEACMNEYGVCISATVSTGVNEFVRQYDPLIPNGLREAYVPCTVIPYIKSAREGVVRLGKIIERYGSAEGNTVLFADSDEAWIMEIVSGHRWAAQRVPDDCCAVIPNCMMLGYIDADDSENYLCSPDLFSMPAEKGFLKTYNGLPHVALTYAPAMSEGNRVRAWGGQHFFAPSQNIPYDSDVFSLFVKPDEPLTTLQCMRLLGYRYQHTPHDADLTASRAIGTESTCEAHLFELRKDAPPLQWLCMGTADHGLFLPCFEGITQTPEAFRIGTREYTPDSAYWIMRTLSALTAAKRSLFSEGVQARLDEYQQALIEYAASARETAAALSDTDRSDWVNEWFAELSEQALERVSTVNHELMIGLTLSELPVFLTGKAALSKSESP